MQLLTRSLKPQFRFEDSRRLSFYAAVFDAPAQIQERTESGDVVTYTEVIKPTAFTDTLAEGGEVVCNLDHDDSQAFARRSDGSLLLQADPKGLFASCWIPDGSFGDGIISRIQAGELDGCSFRFVPVTDRTEGSTVERVKVQLYDVCLTSNPAYPQTKGTVHLRTRANDTYVKYLLAKYKLAKLKGRCVDRGRV
jgi:HK97 family phage prohead protease